MSEPHEVPTAEHLSEPTRAARALMLGAALGALLALLGRRR